MSNHGRKSVVQEDIWVVWMQENFFKYMPVSEFNLRWDLYLTGIGQAAIGAGETYPPPGHPGTYNFDWERGRVLPEYQMVFIASGQGYFESSGTEPQAITAGTMMLLFPGTWHRYRPDPETGWTEHWVSWNGEYLYRLSQRDIISAQHPLLLACPVPVMVAAYERLGQLAQQHAATNSPVLAAHALEILGLALDTGTSVSPVASQEKSANPPLIKDKLVATALDIIWSHSYRINSVDRLVDELPVTRRTLERHFKKVIGRTIREEITLCRVERARQLLQQTALPTEHIALMVGFSSAARMGKVFRALCGITPGEYRRKHTKP